ncbi:cobyrinate a,c-diamide synthase [Chlorobium phaeovibrioides]|nr:cobyrinate a,c-diamide synthase [Chlorobium phaeovibrioides]
MVLTMHKTGFLLAAPSSGSGKTTLTLALLRILAQRGHSVQPFKCGPDYLDTWLHTIAASWGENSKKGINLDTWMASKQHVRDLFMRYSACADASIVEGVMGLFDGAEKSAGSSAEIAKLLHLPVIMVVNAKSMAYSAAPLLHGFRTFDPEVNLAGVIFNGVNTPSHYRHLENAALDAGVEPLGYVPRSDSMTIRERHLGLNISSEYDYDAMIDAMAEHVKKTVDISRLLDIARIDDFSWPSVPDAVQGGNKVIAVARDEAFNFVYQENLDVLQGYGTIVFFSPMDDAVLPEADFLYLSGGYPELYADKLSANSSMRASIADYCDKGGCAYAECGGMMYLGHSITLNDGSAYPMCGVLDFDTTMQDVKMTLGYRKVSLNGGYRGELRGHEFHYSQIKRVGELQNIASITNARDENTGSALYSQGNTLASYVHLYWGENRDFPGYLMGTHK